MGFSIPQVLNAIADAYPDREALVFRDRRFTFAQFMKRCHRLTHFFLEHGITIHQPREALDNWQSGQDHVAIYMQNCNEYLESMVAAMQARAVGFNVNFRYVAEELQYLFNNAGTKAIIYQAKYAPFLSEVLPHVPTVKLLIQVADESGNELLPGAYDYETILSASSDTRPTLETSGDDLYMLYTGGTTGMPKGVLWRQADILVAGLSGEEKNGQPIASLSRFVERAAKTASGRSLPTPPFMHGTGQWVALGAWHAGSGVVIQNNVDRLDAKDLLAVIEKEQVTVLSIVGDAFARPLLDEMRASHYDPSSLKAIISSGAILSPQCKNDLLAAVPGVRIVDTMGSSETGPQARQISNSAENIHKPRFALTDQNRVLSEDLSKVLAPGHDGSGWVAKIGFVPLGYLGDEAKTQKTFPTIDGIRYSVPGDRVRLLENGEIDFLGRDSVTINSGGEKIFAEEVEQALKHHVDVQDVVVSSRPSERWGNEVVAIVQLRDGVNLDSDSLISAAAEHIARYKLPKAMVVVELIQRGANGKADYRWAKQLALKTQSER